MAHNAAYLPKPCPTPGSALRATAAAAAAPRLLALCPPTGLSAWCVCLHGRRVPFALCASALCASIRNGPLTVCTRQSPRVLPSPLFASTSHSGSRAHTRRALSAHISAACSARRRRRRPYGRAWSRRGRRRDALHNAHAAAPRAALLAVAHHVRAAAGHGRLRTTVAMRQCACPVLTREMAKRGTAGASIRARWLGCLISFVNSTQQGQRLGQPVLAPMYLMPLHTSAEVIRALAKACRRAHCG